MIAHIHRGMRFACALTFALIPWTVTTAGAPTASLPSLAPLLRASTPAVVNIAVLVGAPADAGRGSEDAPEGQSSGSGVIIDAAQGLVVTNHHVIDNATDIAVTLKDRRRLSAKLVGSDPATDIALLRIEATGLQQLAFGDSDALEVGDFVVAIGNPFGLGLTATLGIVSALGRSGLGIEGYEDFIQTDASINPGNSGGALVALDGTLVGINTAIIGPSGGNIGIGFAVPSAMAQVVIAQLVEFGEVHRGVLGIGIQDLTPELAEALEVPVQDGAVVSEVAAGSAAAAAGLRPGDVITAVDDRPVRDASNLRNRIGLLRVGTAIRLTIYREGVPVVLETRVAESPAEVAPPVASTEQIDPRLDGLGLAPEPEGLRVTTVAPGSPAMRAGFEPGDLLLAVNRKPVTTLESLAEVLASSQGRMLLVEFQRGADQLLYMLR